MIFDRQLLLSDGQAVTATAVSTNSIQWPDMGRVYGAAADLVRGVGEGNPVPLLVQVTENFATLTSLTITLESADNTGLSSNAVVHWSSGAIAVAALVAGFQVPIRFLPKGIVKPHLGLRYTVAGASATAGKITAGVVAGIQQ